MRHSAQDRERTVQAITQRNRLQRRIKRTQQRMEALQGEARHALETNLAADQALLSELIPTLEQVKAKMRQEEESVRWKTQEALRLRAEWQSRQSQPFPGGNVPFSPGQALSLIAILATIVVIAVGVLLLNN